MYMQILELVAGVAITVRLLASLVVGTTVSLAAAHNHLSITEALLMGLPFVLICMGGFALNDYYDLEKDQINRPYRPLVTGILSRNAVLRVSLSCFALGIGASIVAASLPMDLLWYGTALLGIVLYNVVVRFLAPFKDLYTGVMAAIPFWMVIKKFGYGRPFYWFPIAVILFVMGREIWMDIHDAKGDFLCGLKTLPILMGRRLSGALGSLLLLTAGGVFMAIAAELGSVRAVCVGAMVLVMSCAVGIAWHCSSARWQRRWIYLCWLPMGSSVVLLLCD